MSHLAVPRCRREEVALLAALPQLSESPFVALDPGHPQEVRHVTLVGELDGGGIPGGGGYRRGGRGSTRFVCVKGRAGDGNVTLVSKLDGERYLLAPHPLLSYLHLTTGTCASSPSSPPFPLPPPLPPLDNGNVRLVPRL